MAYELEMFVIYERPTDYPDKFVMRRFAGRPMQGTDYFRTADSLEEIRRHVPPHCARFMRDPNDEPQIVESWI